MYNAENAAYWLRNVGYVARQAYRLQHRFQFLRVSCCVRWVCCVYFLAFIAFLAYFLCVACQKHAINDLAFAFRALRSLNKPRLYRSTQRNERGKSRRCDVVDWYENRRENSGHYRRRKNVSTWIRRRNRWRHCVTWPRRLSAARRRFPATAGRKQLRELSTATRKKVVGFLSVTYCEIPPTVTEISR